MFRITAKRNKRLTLVGYADSATEARLILDLEIAAAKGVVVAEAVLSDCTRLEVLVGNSLVTYKIFEEDEP